MVDFKNILKRYNLKQIDVAKILNKSKATISKYSSGTVSPDIDSYILLSQYLKVSLDELFEINIDFVKITKEEYNELLKVKDIIDKVIK